MSFLDQYIDETSKTFIKLGLKDRIKARNSVHTHLRWLEKKVTEGHDVKLYERRISCTKIIIESLDVIL